MLLFKIIVPSTSEYQNSEVPSISDITKNMSKQSYIVLEKRTYRMSDFELVAPFKPTGDQLQPLFFEKNDS